jgi:hypothetical protein
LPTSSADDTQREDFRRPKVRFVEQPWPAVVGNAPEAFIADALA